MVSTISRKSPISRDPVLSGPRSGRGPRRRIWWLVALLLVAALLIYAWIDGGYREVRVIEERLDPATAAVGPAASDSASTEDGE